MKKKEKTKTNNAESQKERTWHFPFWGRMKINKKRTTLVIDESPAINKKTQEEEPGFVHREATHTAKKGFEKIVPNPDKSDKKPMYLKPARKIPQRLVEPHNKKMDMPKHLEERYSKNNKK